MQSIQSIAELEQNLKLKIESSVAKAARRLDLEPLSNLLVAQIADYGMEALLECTCSAQHRTITTPERGLLHYFAMVELKKTIACDVSERTQLEVISF